MSTPDTILGELGGVENAIIDILILPALAILGIFGLDVTTK